MAALKGTTEGIDMAVETIQSTVLIAEKFPAVLRQAVLDELADRQLDEPEVLAGELGLLPIAARGLLRRHKWSVETSLWVIQTLDLPIELSIVRRTAML